MQRRSAQNNPALPPPLLRSTPRQVRLNASGAVTLISAAALIVGGLWGGVELYRRAQVAEAHLALFSSERTGSNAQVVRVQRRGEDDRRTTVHYRYVAGGQDYSGANTVRRRDRDRYAVGSQIAIWYLASEPEASWIDGYAPERQPIWPAFWVPAAGVATALMLVTLLRRQSQLLTFGRPALGVVTKVEKKRTDKGTVWRVHYEWTLLSGAKRKGQYTHGKKQPPVVGAVIPIVYDRDQPARNSRYPLSLVALSET